MNIRLWGAVTVGAIVAVGWLVLRPGLDRTSAPSTSTLRVGIYALPTALGSPIRALGPPSMYVMTAIFDPLVEVAAGGVPQPALAEAWHRLDSLRWAFRLRPGVSFANGEPMNAEAVVTSIERLLDPATPTVLSRLLGNVAEVRATADLSVEFTTRTPSVDFPNDLAGIWIVPPKAWAAMGETEFARRPVGTGPYRAVLWERNRLVLEAHPGSWRKATIDRVEVTEVADEAARMAAFQSGGIDVVIQVSPDGMDQIAAAGGQTLTIAAGTVYAIALNGTRPGSPFADIRVRQAANYAVNKADIAEVLFHRTAAPMGQPASTITAGYDPDVPAYPYDPARARALMADAGFGDGFDLRLEVITNAVPADAAMFAAVARDLTAAGIRTEVRAAPLPVFFERFYANSFEGLAFQLGFISMPSLDTVKGITDFTCDKPGSTPFMCLPDLQPLIAAARAAADPDERRAAMRAINRAAHDQALALFLVEGVDLFAISAAVRAPAPATRFIHWEDFDLVSSPSRGPS
ncbi:MAG: ABC transporter substrate-binding protein [Rhodospirillaceae bacterium]|nr:ABC transporter substrate-binding protein [Rhodospirillaceae bacterium]